MTFSRTFTEAEIAGASSFTIKPTLRTGACSAAAFEPLKRTVSNLPAAAFFSYVVGTKIPLSTIAGFLSTVLKTATATLNNHKDVQTSSIQIAGVVLRPTIPKVVVDLDCGRFCPDLGDGLFYVSRGGMGEQIYD